MDIEKIMMLIDAVSASPLEKFALEEGNLKISMNKSAGRKVVVTQAENVCEEVQTQQITSAPKAVEPKAEEPEGTVITSPIVGTFYAASSPDAEPFVKVGDVIKKGQPIGIIEAMKLMNEVESEINGKVLEVLVEDGQMVEYDQPLFRVLEA